MERKKAVSFPSTILIFLSCHSPPLSAITKSLSCITGDFSIALPQAALFQHVRKSSVSNEKLEGKQQYSCGVNQLLIRLMAELGTYLKSGPETPPCLLNK